MRDVGRLVHLLRNVPVLALMRALERDGFILERTTRTGGHIYRHPDERTTVVHYHGGGRVLRRKTLASILRATQWTEEDLQELGLV